MCYYENIHVVLSRLSTWEKSFDLNNPVEPLPNDLKAYLAYYGLKRSEISFHFGVMVINNRKIIVQMHVPKNKEIRGTVILLHGYFDHAGHLKNIIHFLLDRKYRVITYDLQGHGLSEGETATIEKFEDYLENLQYLIEEMKSKGLKTPYYLIAHSTGAAIGIHYLLLTKKSTFHKVILLAPLIRSNFWELSKFGYQVLSPFTNEIKRVYARNSTDKKYLKFVKDDPLQYDKVPLSWLKALVRWNEQIQEVDPSNEYISIIQGDRDQTVDWRYNLKFLEGKFPNSEIFMINGGKHHLLNEQSEIKVETFDIIQKILF